MLAPKPARLLTEVELVQVVRTAFDYWRRRGVVVPYRMRRLIERLTIETFKGQPSTNAVVAEFCKRFEAAIKPWVRT